ncbi:MAG: glycosyltransferase [Candidatus Moraniibacteriota bacterium]
MPRKEKGGKIELKNLRVALIHDYLVEYGGAERVMECFADIFPEAPIYTLVYDPKLVNSVAPNRIVRSSFLQKIPFARSSHRFFPLLMPMAAESFDLSYYDLVLSDSASYAKGVITPPKTFHICYCHTPTRYVWDDCQKYVREFSYPGILRRLVPIGLNYVRLWDRLASNRVDAYIANSRLVAERIKKYYQRKSVVINPPVFIEELLSPDQQKEKGIFSRKYPETSQKKGYYLMLGRLMSYKKFDLGIAAFNRLKMPLKIVGGGPELKKLERLAGPTVEIVGSLPPRDPRFPLYFANAKALVFPQEEDFGIVALEAMVSGKPVIAYRAGGALEAVTENVTGLFFNEQTVDSLVRAVKLFENKFAAGIFDPYKINQFALNFRREAFQQKITDFINYEIGIR